MKNVQDISRANKIYSWLACIRTILFWGQLFCVYTLTVYGGTSQSRMKADVKDTVSFVCKEKVEDEPLTILKDYLSKDFLSKNPLKVEKNGETSVECPEYIASDLLKPALSVLSSISALKKNGFSDERISALLKQGVDRSDFLETPETANEFLKILSFLEVPDEHCVAIADQISARYARITGATLTHQIAVANIASFFDSSAHLVALVQPHPSRITKDKREPAHTIIRKLVEDQLNPSAEYRRRMALSLLQMATQVEVQPQVLSQKSWQELELFCGPKSSPQLYLADKIDRTSTEVGKVFFYLKLAKGVADSDELKKNQKIIKQLIDDVGSYKELNRAFAQLKDAEKGVFSFWDPADPFEQNLSEIIFSSTFFEQYASGIKVYDWLNENIPLLEIRERLNQFLVIASLPMQVASNVLSFILLPGLLDLPAAVAQKIPNDEASMSGGLLTLNVINFLNTIYESFNFPENVKFFFYFRAALLLKIMHLADYLEAISKIQTILSKLNGQTNIFESIIKKISFDEASTKVRDLVRTLKASTFRGRRAFPKSPVADIVKRWTGSLIAAYNTVHIHKADLTSIIAAVAELDAMLSVVRLYKEFNKGKSNGPPQNQATFCFPTFTQGNSPVIAVKDVWNPMIDPEKVVTNSMALGTVECPCIGIVTGPNAGGKSTVMKSIVLAIIMAQSLGIAPAQALTFTPFSKIEVYLNITDDIAQGNSLFVAAVLRAKELLDLVKDQEGFTLTAFDELFNGTDMQAGEAAACAMVKALSEYPQNITLVTTHYKKLAALAEQNAHMKNYRVTVDEDGPKLHYPYKLEEGYSKQSIAFKVLAEMGFDPNFIEEAKKYMDK